MASTAHVLTDAQAQSTAEKLRDLNLQLKNMENLKKNYEDELRDYVESTGVRDLGVMVAYEKSSAPKLVGFEGRKMDMVKQEIMERFPDYVRKNLSVADIAVNIESDKTLAAYLKKVGVGIEQKSEIYFKSV